MKKNAIKIITASIVFALGLGLVAVKSNAQPTGLHAANQHIDNYDSYTYSGNYYSSVDASALSEGLNGSLRTKLTTLIHPTQWYKYSSSGEDTLSYRLQYADEDPTDNSKMVYLYTRDSVKKNAASTWNREHVWPQSLSGPTSDNKNWGESQAGADLLHIRPTYNSTNSERSNDIYADTNKANPLTYNGMLYGYETGTRFEPLDSVKGDVARIIMYIWVAYKNHYSTLPDVTKVFESYDTLLKWHTADEPDALEGNRNDYVESTKQKNRNPFVDHPEYAWMIFGDSASASVKQECKEKYPSDSGGTTKTLTSISISGEATKKEYEEGESFNPQGLTVTANYSDSSQTNVSLSDCQWTPDPLTEGVTEITCTYKNFTATYSGITVTKPDVPPVIVDGDEFKVTFKNGTSGSGVSLSASDVADQFESNTLIDTVTSVTQVYTGSSGIRIGSRSNSGQVVFKLKQNAQKNIQNIQVKCSKYSDSDTGVLLVKYDNQTITSQSDGVGVDFTKTFTNPVNATTMTVGTSSGRTYVKEIIVTIKGDDPIDPPPSSSSSSLPPSSTSSMPSSSSTSVPSSTSSSSSIESSSSSEEPSSTSIIPSTTSMEQSSSSEVITTTTTNPPSSSEAISSSQEEGGKDDKKRSGCGGSVTMILPLTGFSALVGLVFIFSKKKK